MQRGHHERDTWRNRLEENAPDLHAAALAALSPELQREAEVIEEVRERIDEDLGDRLASDLFKVEPRAEKVGLKFIYDTIYRYESSVVHPTLFAGDVMFEPERRGLRLRDEPSWQFAHGSVYLQAALLLNWALLECGRLVPSLRSSELLAVGDRLHALTKRELSEGMPEWRQLLPEEMRNL